MLKINLAGTDYQLPESWADVQPAQLPGLIELLFLREENGATYHDLLRLVLGMTEKQWESLMREHFGPKRTNAQRDANAAVLHDLLSLLRWMWSQPIERKPMQWVRVSGQNWLLPDENFQNMSWGELSDAYVHYNVFVQQLVEGDEHLNLLVATLCRPKRERSTIDASWNGDPREPYNEFLCKNRTAVVAKLPLKTRLAVLMYFGGTLKKLFDQYDLTSGIGSKADEEYPGQSFVKNTHLLAQKGVFGNFDKTRDKNCHDVLLFLEENRKDVEAEIEAYKRANPDS